MTQDSRLGRTMTWNFPGEWNDACMFSIGRGFDRFR